MLKKYSDTNKVKVTIKDNTNEISIHDISTNEDILLTPKNMGIEILEDKIIKFNSGNINDIMETIKTKYTDTDYFIRKKDNELHIVKYNEKLNLNINEFVNSLLKYYSTKNPKITEGIKVKGNHNFTIIENMKTIHSEKFILDLTELLSKKNKE
ncbi:MAG: hypothetical protein JXA99_11970 [Candidatus Lokiarchaeota archaeon]|jgi:hypothetical protein|nr:hypothetical protein [Candidatus Lokiarchaeota archaeon]